MAPLRRRCMTQSELGFGDHLTEVVADQQILMERKDHAGGRSIPFHVRERLDPYSEIVVEVNRVGLELAQQGAELPLEGGIGVAQLEVVEAMPGVEKFARAVRLLEHNPRFCPMLRPVGRQEPGLGPGLFQCAAILLVRDDLGSALAQARVGVANNQEAALGLFRHRVPSGYHTRLDGLASLLVRSAGLGAVLKHSIVLPSAG